MLAGSWQALFSRQNGKRCRDAELHDHDREQQKVVNDIPRNELDLQGGCCKIPVRQHIRAEHIN
jgi:hypothetical protein